MKPNLLVIDDNPDVIKALKVLFHLDDIHCHGALSPQEGLRLLSEHKFDLVIQDMNFSTDTISGEEGIQLFRDIRAQYVDMPIILLTAWANLESAVQLVKAGAADYLSKPWDDDKLLVTVKNLIELNQLQSAHQGNQRKKSSRVQQLQSKFDLCGLQFASDVMINLLEMATQVANSDVPVLIRGPNGAGKEKIAEVLQANSRFRDAPFVKVNIGALPNDLMEAELFGAEAGAFTGNTKRRIGRFEAANNGTLFLDEIGNLSLEGQKKLLRVLELGEFERLGSTETQKVRVRILSATNTDLSTAIKEGTFREDLYYRLNLIELSLPPLSERMDDLPLLSQFFLEDDFELSEEAEELLHNYHWPGNVRELQNCMKRAMLLSQSHLIEPLQLGIQLDSQKMKDAREALTKNDIIEALEQHDHVIAKTAKALNLSRQALYRRMDKFGIET
ncbi:sigma-54-dependent Fis family transcriptional regulator [Alteromonadaceae bacterium M269]|nr:sigma-54-dependent Fis family transcriptional regulator [Alteromonadaceae bacterium M269]